MSADITIEGLTPKQMILADIMWSLEGYHDVQTFIGTLPVIERRECLTIIELMKLAVIEQELSDMSESGEVLMRFTKKN